LAWQLDVVEETQTDDVRDVDALGGRCDRESDRFIHELSYPCKLFYSHRPPGTWK